MGSLGNVHTAWAMHGSKEERVVLSWKGFEDWNAGSVKLHICYYSGLKAFAIILAEFDYDDKYSFPKLWHEFFCITLESNFRKKW